MNWLISKIVGNPYVLIVLISASFVAGMTTGGSASWYVQGLRLTASEQAHIQHVQEQTQIRQEAIDAANIQRDQADQSYQRASKLLADSVSAGDVMRRCIAAGKCGVRYVARSCPAIESVSPAERPDVASANTVFAPAEPAAKIDHTEHVLDMVDPVVNDCAVTTLMLNSLQADIEGQKGY